jgi:hypothetical protein
MPRDTMLRTICLLSSLLVTALPANSQTQSLTNTAEIRKFTDSVMMNVGVGKYNSAWMQIQPYIVIPQSELNAFSANFTSQLPTINTRYGSAVGSDFIREDRAGGSLVRLTYISKHQRSAIRWYFVFYRSEKGWVMTDFKFDGNILDVF